MASKTIVFIHGMYMTPLCWEQWIDRYRAKGYTCLAPAWPGRDLPVETLRQRHPDPQLGQLTLTKVVEHLANTIHGLDEKPMLIGHSMGGLIVQLLLQKDIAAAGVAIDSAPPRGVFTTKWSFLKSNWPHITPFASLSKPIAMTFERFQYAFVNTLPLAQQQAAFEKYVVPESRRVPRESLTAKVDFKKPHPPLLLIAGSIDHIIPASLNQSNYTKYASSASVTDFKEFAGRTHYIIGQENWEEVADYGMTWLNEHTN
ncbi:MAG TPA: alpha/beta hydrolase [Anaerolineae bacterium]|nr:alpha/beta hydrolase [Anaerolineae bacterium]